MKPLPLTAAGRLHMIMELLNPPIYDDEGNLVGYEEEGLITKEEALKLLDFPQGAEQLKNGYLIIQADSGHWYARAPNGDESTIHWSKLAIRKWIRAHVRKDKRGKK